LVNRKLDEAKGRFDGVRRKADGKFTRWALGTLSVSDTRDAPVPVSGDETNG